MDQPSSRTSLRSAAGLAVLLLVFGLWAGWFIHRSSFDVEGRRYFCLFDDAMISMTYARNLVEGHGLEWARWGKPVEGFTHPLWTFLMVPVNALPIPLPDRSLLVQLLSLLTLAGTVVAVRRLMIDHFSPGRARHWLPAAVLTAFYYPLAYWALMGMETGLQALLTVVAVQLALTTAGSTTAESGRDRNFALWIVCAAAFLLRMDMLLLVVAVQAYVLLRRGFRQMGTRSWLAGLAVFCGMTLAYGLFRWVYYHDLLPNTYYLKLQGVPLAVRLLRGLTVLMQLVRGHLAILLVAGFGTVAVLRRNRRLILPAVVFALYCAYDVYVGGDAWDGDILIRANRFVAFVMPLLFVLLNATFNEALAAWRSRREGVEEDDPAGRFVLGLATVAALLIANGLWLSERDDDYWRELALLDRPPMTERHQRVAVEMVHFQRFVRPGAVVATAWAGIPAYFSDYRMIDILGYNDRTVAHMQPVVPLDEDNFDTFRPGHVKWDEQRLLGVQRPDAFFQIWGIKRGMGKVADVLPSYGYRKVGRFWVRTDSPYLQAGAAPAPAEEEEPAAGDDSPGAGSPSPTQQRRRRHPPADPVSKTPP
jgi:arabinofuranosyltransferase